MRLLKHIIVLFLIFLLTFYFFIKLFINFHTDFLSGCTILHSHQLFTMCVCAQTLCHVQLFTTPWTVACQAPLSMGFSQQEYWSGVPCPPPGDLPNPGIEPASLTSSALTGGFFAISAIWEAHSLQGFPFLHILEYFCFLLVYFFNNGHPNRCKVISHSGFDLHLIWLVISSIFSYTCWSSLFIFGY